MRIELNFFFFFYFPLSFFYFLTFTFHFSTSRLIEKAYKIGNFRFPAGVVIQFPIYNIHHDEKIWENPEKFDPSRYSIYFC